MAEDFETERDSLMGELSQHALEGAVGKEFDFYGAANNQFKLDDTVWEAMEDPDDGYRSHLGCVMVRPESQTIFFQTSLGRVRLFHRATSENDFYQIVDMSDGHIWLTFGTDQSDSYYPCFTFRYEPKENQNDGLPIAT
jgi:hypothetical protein